jgi:membrane fusion protein (multidrug efflux system)
LQACVSASRFSERHFARGVVSCAQRLCFAGCNRGHEDAFRPQFPLACQQRGHMGSLSPLTVAFPLPDAFMLDRRHQSSSDKPEHDIIDLHEDDDRRSPTKGKQAEPDPGQKKPDSKESESSEGKDKKGEAKKDGEQNESLWDRVRQHKIAVIVAAAILVIGAVAAIIWYLHARNYESTDDAFIDGHPVAVSPQVSGNIVSVPVTDNQIVKAGDLLAAIDPRDYQAALGQAEAQIAQANASIASARAQVETQKAEIEQAAKQVVSAQAALSFAHDQDTRAQQLVKTGFGTVQNAQQTASDLRSKQASYDAAVASRDAAQRRLKVLQAQIESGEGQLRQATAQKAKASADLSRTTLHATVDGRVTRLSAAVGAAATPGQALMILVPTQLWVTANFKETQLAHLRPGQPVDIEIDAFGRSYPGHVDSVQAGSGTAFSLLPAENATGNYVKVVQRIPVKLTFDQMPGVEIGPGMSVVPTVKVR